MAKTTKQSSAETGETAVKPVRKKAASTKKGVRKASTKSTVTSKNASSKKAITKKQPVAKKAVEKKAATKKKAVPKRRAATGAVVHRQITDAERRQMIAEAAYVRAESQGFLSDERDDWLLAEAEVDSLLTRAGVIVTD
jgi:hypothetical protein